jgi:hypothetical protein
MAAAGGSTFAIAMPVTKAYAANGSTSGIIVLTPSRNAIRAVEFDECCLNGKALLSDFEKFLFRRAALELLGYAARIKVALGRCQKTT